MAQPILSQLEQIENIQQLSAFLSLLAFPLDRISGEQRYLWGSITKDLTDALKATTSSFLETQFNTTPSLQRSTSLCVSPFDYVPDAIVAHTIGFVGGFDVPPITKTSKQFHQLIHKHKKECVRGLELDFKTHWIEISSHDKEKRFHTVPPLCTSVPMSLSIPTVCRLPDDILPLVESCGSIKFVGVSSCEGVTFAARKLTISSQVLRGMKIDLSQFPNLEEIGLAVDKHAQKGRWDTWITDDICAKIVSVEVDVSCCENKGFPFSHWQKMTNLRRVKMARGRFYTLPPAIELEMGLEGLQFRPCCRLAARTVTHFIGRFWDIRGLRSYLGRVADFIPAFECLERVTMFVQFSFDDRPEIEQEFREYCEKMRSEKVSCVVPAHRRRILVSADIEDDDIETKKIILELAKLFFETVFVVEGLRFE